MSINTLTPSVSLPGHMPLPMLYRLWDELGNVPVNDYGILDEPFLHFERGTNSHDVWHWFEARNPEFVVGEVMQGIRR